MQQVYSRSRFYLQCLGAIALLTAALFQKHPSFDFIWFLFALLIAVGFPLLNVWVTSAFGAITRRNTELPARTPDYHSAQKYFLAAEDGVLLLPLLWIGISVLTAVLASLLYALFIFRRRQSFSMVVTRSLAYFVLIIWVLPHGLWMVVAAHVVAEIAIRYLFPYWFTVEPVAQQEGAG